MNEFKFDYEKYAAEHKQRRIEAKERGLKNLAAFLEVARDEGIEYGCVSFSGSGDSGSIDYVNLKLQNGMEYEGNAELGIAQEKQSFLNGEWRKEPVNEIFDLRDALTNIVYDLLEETDVDWYNNDGGFGDFNLDVAAGKYSLDVNVNLSHSETAYYTDVDIATGEEIE